MAQRVPNSTDLVEFLRSTGLGLVAVHIDAWVEAEPESQCAHHRADSASRMALAYSYGALRFTRRLGFAICSAHWLNWSMESIWSYLISLLLSGLGMLLVSRLLPGMKIDGGLGSAVIVSLVYGFLKMALQKILIVLAFPLVAVTLGAFILVINAFLLWLTDKLLKRFEVDSFWSLLVGAGLLSLVDMAVRWIMSSYFA